LIEKDPYRFIEEVAITKESLINPNVATVEGAVNPRRQGCSYSALPQTLYNVGDAVASAFPQGS